MSPQQYWFQFQEYRKKVRFSLTFGLGYFFSALLVLIVGITVDHFLTALAIVLLCYLKSFIAFAFYFRPDLKMRALKLIRLA